MGVTANRIWIGEFHLNGVESAASVGVGPQIRIGHHSQSKSSIGNGKISGDFSSMPTLVAWLDDQDFIDAPVSVCSPGPDSKQGG